MAGLAGMKAICEYMNRSEATVLTWHRDYGLPIAKIGGTWEGDTGKIDDWRRQVIDESENGVARPARTGRRNGRKKAV